MQHQHRNPFSRQPEINAREIRIDLSFRKVFFIIAGALVGGLVMTIPTFETYGYPNTT